MAVKHTISSLIGHLTPVFKNVASFNTSLQDTGTSVGFNFDISLYHCVV